MARKKAKPCLQLKLNFSKSEYEDLMASCELQVTDYVFDTLLAQSYQLARKRWEYDSSTCTFNVIENWLLMEKKLNEHMKKLREFLSRVAPLHTQAVAAIEMAPSSRKKSTESVVESMELYVLGQLSVLTVMETICVDMCSFWRHAWEMSRKVAPGHPFAVVQAKSYSENVKHLDTKIEKLQDVYDELYSNIGEIIFNTHQRAPSTTALFIPRDLRKMLLTEPSVKYKLAEFVDNHYATDVIHDDTNDNNNNEDSNKPIFCSVTGKRWRREVMDVASLVPQSPLVPDWGMIVFNDRACYYTFLSMRNCIRVHKDVKRALDMNRITLVPVLSKLGSGKPIECKVQVIDKSILEETILDNKTDDSIYWLDVADMPKLQFQNINRPGLSNMYHHTVMALIFSARHAKVFKGYKDAMNRFLTGEIWPRDMKQQWLYRPVLDILMRRIRAKWPEFPGAAREGTKLNDYEPEFEGSIFFFARQCMSDMCERYIQTRWKISDEAKGRSVSQDYACNEGYV